LPGVEFALKISPQQWVSSDKSMMRQLPQVTCRPFVPSDLKALYAIEEACFEPLQRFSRSLMRSLSEDPLCSTWMGMVSGIRAGFAIIGLTHEGDKATAYVWTIEVLPAFRRLGIARQLLMRMDESARQAGCTSIELHVAAENLNAQALYQEFGFVHNAVDIEFYGEGKDGFRYRKLL
jgi:ribosomal-protein-alanine N-acetyltransferase